MSRESAEWLNGGNILVGFTNERGLPWFNQADLQGEESPIYGEAIPMDDVIRRLFDWEALDTDIYVPSLTNPGEFVKVPGRKAIQASDNGDILGIFKDGYQGHPYAEWLLNNVSSILDDTLQIGSAGLLRNRGVAFVQVEMPENITTPSGIEFRPNLLATTSFDGTVATTYKRTITVVVCDNTRDAAMREDGQEFKVRHSKYSLMKLHDAREALNIVYSMADDFTKRTEALTSWKVDEKTFLKVLNAIHPEVKDTDNRRGVTVAEKKRDEIIHLYCADEKSASWNGTAWGVIQAFDTWNHHMAQVRGGVGRAERNFENVISGKFADADSKVLAELIKATPKRDIPELILS